MKLMNVVEMRSCRERLLDTEHHWNALFLFDFDLHYYFLTIFVLQLKLSNFFSSCFTETCFYYFNFIL